MKTKGSKHRKRKIYGLYDKNTEQLIMTGTMEELAEYCDRTVSSMHHALLLDRVVARKYKVHNLDFSEYIFPKTKICTHCGKNKPITDFEFIPSRNAYRSVCRLCRRKLI